jgi:hypothetical protein
MVRTMKLTLAVMAGCILAGAQTARADATSDARKAIQAAYDKSNAAAAKKDLAGVLASHASDFTYTDKSGKKQDLSAMKTQMGQVFQASKEISGKSVIQSISLKGGSATVTVDETGSMVLVNPQNPDQTVKLEVEAKSEDLWAKTGKGWRIKSSREISSKQLINGKPFVPPGGK